MDLTGSPSWSGDTEAPSQDTRGAENPRGAPRVVREGRTTPPTYKYFCLVVISTLPEFLENEKTSFQVIA